MMVLDTNRIYEFKLTPTYQKFYSPDSSYGIYVANTSDASVPESKSLSRYTFTGDKAEEQLYEITILGKMEELTIGNSYDVRAKLSYSKKYRNWSYEVISMNQNIPKTINEQKAFLSTVVTPIQAETLLSAYPDIVQKVVSGDIEDIDLNLTKGIKDKTWENIKTKILENYVIADILTLLIPLGINYNKIKKLLDDEPNPKILKQKLINDPYVISDVDGISWKTADSIALKLNPDLLVSLQRTKCFINTYLRELGDSDGHTWQVYDDLLTAVKENVLECEDVFIQIIEEERENPKLLYIENEKIGLKYYHDIEVKIWNIINDIANTQPLAISEENVEKGIAYSENVQGFIFTDEQKDILRKSVGNNLTILQGSAGTGKTSLLRGMMNIYQQAGYMIGACALSSKAARRIKESTGHDASTIHRLLGAQGLNQFSYNIRFPLPYSVIVLDEFSMLGSSLFYHLVSAIQQGAKLIVCGDLAQLSALGWGSPFADIVNSKFEEFMLTKILRQAEKSAIITCGNQMRQGLDPLNGKYQLKTVLGEQEDLFIMFRDDKKKLRDIAVKTFMGSIEKYGLDECYIITTRRSKAINSVEEINKIVQDLMLDDTLPFVKFGDKKYKLGARVLATKNNYEKGSMNGMIGYITHVNGMKGGVDGGDGLIVDFPDGIQVEYTKIELKELDLGYALTTHKFQGSEARLIIGIIDNAGFLLLNRGMVYTMVTRARERMLLLAEPYAYESCLKNDYSLKKNTWSKFFEKQDEEIKPNLINFPISLDIF